MANDKEDMKEETEAAKTLAPNSRTGMVSAMVDVMSKIEMSELIDLFNKSMAQFGPNVAAGQPIADNSKQNMASIAAKGTVKEDVNSLFEGSDLTEETKEKILTIFEAALNMEINQEKIRLQEENEKFIEKEIGVISDTLNEQYEQHIDKYLNYAVDSWIEENKVAIESSLKTNLVEAFLRDLKKLFELHNIEVPSDKIDLYKQAVSEKDEVEKKLAEEIEKTNTLQNDIETIKKDLFFEQESSGMILTDKVKLKNLIESIKNDDFNNFKKKLKIIKEDVLNNTSSSNTENINEIDGVDTLSENENKTTKDQEIDPAMKRAIEHIRNSSKKQ